MSVSINVPPLSTSRFNSMPLECPNCKAPITFLRVSRTFILSSFPCKTCSSVLRFSIARRLLGTTIGFIVYFIVMPLIEANLMQFDWKWQVAFYASFLVLVTCVIFPFEKVILVAQGTISCKRCGYDIRGLENSRCPECGLSINQEETKVVDVQNS